MAGLVLAVGAGAGLVRGTGGPADVGALPGAGTRAGAALAPAAPARPPPSSAAPALPAPGPAAPIPAAGTPGAAAAAPGVQPERLLIPRLGVAALVLPVGVDPAAGLAVPADPHRVGWWAGGAVAGTGTGTVLIDGHVDSAGAGPGALFRLREMRPGDRVLLTGAGRRAAYRVVARRQYPKPQLPWSQLFDQQVVERLVLISCGGSFAASSRHYRDNVVVVAVPQLPAAAGGAG